MFPPSADLHNSLVTKRFHECRLIELFDRSLSQNARLAFTKRIHFTILVDRQGIVLTTSDVDNLRMQQIIDADRFEMQRTAPKE